MTLTVALWSPDLLTVAGVEAALATDSEIAILPMARFADAQVVVIADYAPSHQTMTMIARLATVPSTRIVLVVDSLSDSDVRIAAPVTMAVLPRSSVTAETLVPAVRAAAGGTRNGNMDGMLERVAPDLLRPVGSDRIVLTNRERDMLALLVNGQDTAAIAAALFCSERTVKTAIGHVIERLGMRNRAQTVAFAIREGLI